jgi:hypothetical protein
MFPCAVFQIAWSKIPKSDAPEEKLRCLAILRLLMKMKIISIEADKSFMSLDLLILFIILKSELSKNLFLSIIYLIDSKNKKPMVGPEIFEILKIGIKKTTK